MREEGFERCVSCGSVLLWAAFGYVVSAGTAILLWNASLGHLLPDTGRYGKWRGEARDFAGVCFLFGTWVYPAAIGAFIGFVSVLVRDPNTLRKTISLVAGVTMLLFLMEFVRLGVSPTVGN